MDAPSIPASGDKWRWHQAFAIGLCFLWPAWGISYLSADEDDAWSAKCNMLYVVALLLWMLTTPSSSVQMFVSVGLLWVFITWTVALGCIPRILKSARAAARVYRPQAIVVPALWIAIVVLNFFLFSPWTSLTIMTAPASTSPLLPSGTPYFALGFDRYDLLNRGQLVTYRAGQELRIARIIAVPGDVVRIDRTTFFVNGAQFTAATSYPIWLLRDMADALRHPAPSSESREIIDIEDFTDMLASAPAGAVMRVDRREILVADDSDLVQMSKRTLKPALINVEDVVAVPVAKVWSLDKPGRFSDIAQPTLEFDQ